MTYFIIGLLAAAIAFAFTRRILPPVVNGLVFTAITWLTMPTFAWGFYGALFLCVLAVAAGYVWCLAIWMYTNDNYGRSEVKYAKEAYYGGIAVGAFALLFLALIPMFTTWGAFHASTYQSLLEVEEKNFDTQQVLLDQSQARFVDQALARRSAEELLGNMRGLGSRCRIGDMSIQSVNGRLWWVAPLEHKDFFKWWSNGTCPGYMMVSASNYSDSRYVENYELRYGMGSSFNDYVPRHLYQNGYATVGLDDYTFELDDDGHPYWVVTIVKPRVGFGGFVANGVVTVDAVSGSIKEYSIEDAPAWIDRIQPEGIVESRIDDWGDYIHGWWNSMFAERDVINASQGTSLVYTADGRSAWYTGLQSSGASDQGTMGFMLVDTRTGKASFYRRAGITEAAAKQVIEGQVQEKGYASTWPVPYLVDGVPTYISVLKDKAGNPQMIGMVAYNDRTIVAVSEGLRETLRSYASRLRSKGTSLSIDGEVKLVSFEGNVVRIGRENIGDETIIYLMLDTVESKAFAVPSHLSQEVLLTEKGDAVKVSALDTGNGIINVESFDNLQFQLSVTEDQAKIEERYQEAIKSRQERKERLDTSVLLKLLETIAKQKQVSPAEHDLYQSLQKLLQDFEKPKSDGGN